MAGMTSPKKAIALLSSGLDSSVALASVIAQNYDIALALTVDYGQRAAVREIEAARKIAQYYDIAHQVVELPWLRELLPKALTSGEKNNWPEAGAPGAEALKMVWVPNRNGVLLNVAAAYAEAMGADAIIFGANAEEAVDFPDNTPAYRDQLNAAFEYSTMNHVKIETPVGNLTKPQIVELAAKLKAPLHLVWSCYEEGVL